MRDGGFLGYTTFWPLVPPICKFCDSLGLVDTSSRRYVLPEFQHCPLLVLKRLDPVLDLTCRTDPIFLTSTQLGFSPKTWRPPGLVFFGFANQRQGGSPKTSHRFLEVLRFPNGWEFPRPPTRCSPAATCPPRLNCLGWSPARTMANWFVGGFLRVCCCWGGFKNQQWVESSP